MTNSQNKFSSFTAPVEPNGFNARAILPYKLKTQDIQQAMNDFVHFLDFVNLQLASKEIGRLETMLMPANFSSMVGEFMVSNIPKYCASLAKNNYHNGHPDLIPIDKYPKCAIQYCSDGIEIKASRYLKGWQGHNPENIWLMVFVFDSSRAVDQIKQIPPKPFKFLAVYGAELTKDDWLYAGRSATSRRTITASVKDSGYKKMTSNWIYKSPK